MKYAIKLREIAKENNNTALLLMTYEIDEAIEYMEKTLKEKIDADSKDKFSKNIKAQLNNATWRRYKLISWIGTDSKVSENTKDAYAAEVEAIENSIYALLYDLWVAEEQE